MKNFAFTEPLLGGYVIPRVKVDLGIVITSGVPEIIGDHRPHILIEKGLAGSQVILTQDNIDELLGTEQEVTASLAFGSTAMVADDTFGLVLDCGQQVESVEMARGYRSGASLLSLVEASTSLPDSAFTGLEVLVTGAGNLVVRYQETNITAAATNELFLLELYLRMK